MFSMWLLHNENTNNVFLYYLIRVLPMDDFPVSVSGGIDTLSLSVLGGLKCDNWSISGSIESLLYSVLEVEMQ